MDTNIIKTAHLQTEIEKLHKTSYKREYINIVNPCTFFLSKLEEMKSCIICKKKTAYAWVRVSGCWHHLLVVLVAVVDKTVTFMSQRVGKIQFVPEIF